MGKTDTPALLITTLAQFWFQEAAVTPRKVKQDRSAPSL